MPKSKWSNDDLEPVGLVLSDDQKRALKAIRDWYRGKGRYFRLGGLAGTGKTTITTRVAGVLGLDGLSVGYAAYTGKAVRVLTRKLQEAAVGGAVGTLHSILRRPEELHCSRCPSIREEGTPCHGRSDCGCSMGWESARDRQPWDLLIVDEASMVPQDIFDELMEETDYRVLFVGDHGQLPPVKSRLDLMADPDVRLEQIHRQRPGSAILTVAAMARQGKSIPYGPHGDDVVKGPREGLQIDWDDDPDALLICFDNKERVRLNQEARRALGYGPEPAPGDRVVCRFNNHRAEIANGMFGVIRSVKRRDARRYNAEIWLPDEGRMYSGVISGLQLEAEKVLEGVRGADLWQYAYAVTTWVSQGSQADDVILYDAPDWYRRRAPEEYRRWLYTGITRAAKSLTIVA